MNKKTRDLYAAIYEKVMCLDSKVYQGMYRRIFKMTEGKDVLEIAVHSGLLAKHAAYAANSITTADETGECSDNLIFNAGETVRLPYKEDSFDVVLVVNELHAMPEPEKALKEIGRVLKEKGVLIALDRVNQNHKAGAVNGIWSKILRAAGRRSGQHWDMESCRELFENNGWEVKNCREIPARIPAVYVECVKNQSRKIRYADEKDFELLREYDKHISEIQLKNSIRAKRVLMMFHNDDFAGWLRFGLFWDSMPFLNMLYFQDTYRGKGYGRQLVDFWEKEMLKNKYDMVLTSTLSNEQAQSFYRKMGYMDCGCLLIKNEPLEIILSKPLV